MIRACVIAAFIGFSARFEGRCNFLYCDILGLVTTAIGDLVDDPADVMGLPFFHNDDGRPASPAEINAEWHLVKRRQDLRSHGGMAYKAITTLHMSPEAVESLVLAKLEAVGKQLSKRFAGFDTWPADAQLGALSWAWACGAAAPFPHFSAALNAQDFAAAAIESHIDATDNPGIVPRNIANVLLFQNAANVVAGKLDPSTLYYPHALLDPTAPNAIDDVLAVIDAVDMQPIPILPDPIPVEDPFVAEDG